MIVRLEGILERVEGGRVVVSPEGGAVAHEVLVARVVGEMLMGREGERVVLHTMEYLEGVSQGSSFVPRMVGFLTEEQKRFFEVFTGAKGLGTRKALKAMAAPVGVMARAIREGDVKMLQTLPEIGKRLAETVVVDLKGKMDPFVGAEGEVELKGSGVDVLGSDAARQAVAALVQLGDTKADAERLVAKALEQSGGGEAAPDELLALAFSIRS